MLGVRLRAAEVWPWGSQGHLPLERGQQGACREDLLARPVIPCSRAESQWNSDCVTPWVDSGNPHKHARHIRHIKHSLLKGKKEMIDFIHLKESQR